MRVILATLEEYNCAQRKLAWFSRHGNHLYFNVGGSYRGLHTSYHEDGNVFITDPAREETRFINKILPLDQFRGWHQFGTIMFMNIKNSRELRWLKNE